MWERKGKMIALEPSDEKTHPAGSHKYWNESFYLNFFDTQGVWGGASRIGFSPNQGFADGFVLLYFSNGAVGFIRTWEECADHSDRSAVGPLEHACIEPFVQWRVRYRGPIYYFEAPARMGDFAQIVLSDLPRREIELDIQFEAIHEAFDFHDSMKRELVSGRELLAKLKPGYSLSHLGLAMQKLKLLRVMSNAQHYEHAGRIHGRILVEGEAHDFDGFGQRDHSWGVRDMRVPSNWRWFSGQFSDELCFNATRVELLGFRASGGYVYHEEKAEALKDWSLEADLDDSRLWAKNISLVLTCKSGKRFDLSGTALANIPVIVNTGGYVSVVNEARVLFKWGNRTGYGISEFMEQLI